MSNLRLIARLDIKGPNLVKGVQFEGLRIMGNPQSFAQRYYEAGVDEIIYMDIVASLYGRNSLTDIVKHTARNIFVPLTVGGGIRSTDDVRELLCCGADKIAVNTAAIKCPQLITDIARRFGSQCMVLSIEAKKTGPGNKWEAYSEYGRQETGLDAVQWAIRGQELGAGEILLTSIDQEGTRKGFDIELVRQVTAAVTIPVICSGGMGKVEDLLRAAKEGGADAVAMADILHQRGVDLRTIREEALAANLPVRAL